MNDFIATSANELKAKGIDRPDIVIITPDAYVDHPAFSMAILARVLESKGFAVAILTQPDFKKPEDFKKLGKPKLFFAVSCGNMDSMINKYTNNGRLRSEDDFSAGAVPLNRPDRALITYSNMVKAAFKDVPVIIGGLEATMRRFTHYDFWSDSLKKPILLDSRAELLVHGMGEKQIIEIAQRMSKGENINDIRDIAGTGYKLGAKANYENSNAIHLPSHEEIASDKDKFCLMTKLIMENLNPYCAKPLAQKSDGKTFISNPPAKPLSEKEMDEIYDLNFLRKPHFSYKKPIPAFEAVKNSLIIHRGCFGGCAFCSLGHHQGKFIQTRSEESIKKELARMKEGNKLLSLSDLGAPSANMYAMAGKDFSLCQNCKKDSCLFPSICENLNTSHEKLKSILKNISSDKAVKNVFISSGIRADLALLDEDYIRLIAQNHTSGYLKLAPEHTDENILFSMRKPPITAFEKFKSKFLNISKTEKKEQYIIPYFISSYPGVTIEKAIEMAVYMKKNNIRSLQINDFLPTPGEYATAVYYTGKDPLTMQEVYVPKKESERKAHRALIQYFKKENIPLLIKTLKKANRKDLISFFIK